MSCPRELVAKSKGLLLYLNETDGIRPDDRVRTTRWISVRFDIFSNVTRFAEQTDGCGICSGDISFKTVFPRFIRSRRSTANDTKQKVINDLDVASHAQCRGGFCRSQFTKPRWSRSDGGATAGQSTVQQPPPSAHA